MPAFLVILLKILAPLTVILSLLPFLIWLERKGSAYIQDRPGPNRAAVKGVRLGGLIHPIADVVKLFFKEETVPGGANRPFYLLAPVIALFVAFTTYVVIPFAGPIAGEGGIFTFQSADLDVGILYILAVSSLGVYGVLLAGWSSNNKYALLGSVRSGAQMLSYELAMGLAVLSVVMTAGSFELSRIVSHQGAMPWGWNALVQPVACLIFVVSAFAETNRVPFDLPEGEAELVAGYHVEYSSMKFAAFFMAEYVHIIIASALIATLFFGGWQIPFVPTEVLRDNAGVVLQKVLLAVSVFSAVAGAFLLSRFSKGRYGDKRDYEVVILGAPALAAGLMGCTWLAAHGPFLFLPEAEAWTAAGLQATAFLAKILFFCWVFIWVRWTLPRFRYDQLMRLGWKGLLPAALANVFVYAAAMLG